MQSIKNLLKRSEEARKKLFPKGSSPTSEAEKKWDCEICQDKGYIPQMEKWTATICICEQKKQIQKLFQSAMIPDEFEEATFENYQTQTQTQKEMKKLAQTYVLQFDQIRHTAQNSLGLIAELGESIIGKEQNQAKKDALKEKYSNYGIGKTHLTIAIAKELLEKGIPVLVVNDEWIMEELAIYRVEDVNHYEKLVKMMMDVEVLVWDDLGKSNSSDFKQRVCYRVINQRYLKRLPIIFSSNECLEGLDNKLGSATFSRLLGMSKNYFLEVKGDDMRIG